MMQHNMIAVYRHSVNVLHSHFALLYSLKPSRDNINFVLLYCLGISPLEENAPVTSSLGPVACSGFLPEEGTDNLADEKCTFII